jgi:hypothetical protein
MKNKNIMGKIEVSNKTQTGDPNNHFLTVTLKIAPFCRRQSCVTYELCAIRPTPLAAKQKKLLDDAHLKQSPRVC